MPVIHQTQCTRECGTMNMIHYTTIARLQWSAVEWWWCHWCNGYTAKVQPDSESISAHPVSDDQRASMRGTMHTGLLVHSPACTTELPCSSNAWMDEVTAARQLTQLRIVASSSDCKPFRIGSLVTAISGSCPRRRRRSHRRRRGCCCLWH